MIRSPNANSTAGFRACCFYAEIAAPSPEKRLIHIRCHHNILVSVADFLKGNQCKHLLAEQGKKHTQAFKIVGRQIDVQIVGNGCKNGVELTRSHEKSPLLYKCGQNGAGRILVFSLAQHLQLDTMQNMGTAENGGSRHSHLNLASVLTLLDANEHAGMLESPKGRRHSLSVFIPYPMHAKRASTLRHRATFGQKGAKRGCRAASNRMKPMKFIFFYFFSQSS